MATRLGWVTVTGEAWTGQEADGVGPYPVGDCTWAGIRQALTAGQEDNVFTRRDLLGSRRPPDAVFGTLGEATQPLLTRRGARQDPCNTVFATIRFPCPTPPPRRHRRPTFSASARPSA